MCPAEVRLQPNSIALIGGVTPDCNATNLSSQPCENIPGLPSTVCPRSNTSKTCYSSQLDDVKNTAICDSTGGDYVCNDDAEQCAAVYEAVLLDQTCTEKATKIEMGDPSLN